MMRWLCSLSFLVLLTSCQSTPTPPPEPLVFVRGGVLAPAGSGGQPVAGDRELVARTWSAGETITLGTAEDTAPATPECVPLFSVPLGNVDAMISMGAEAPNTALAWSPDGGRLAVGSYLGEVLVINGWTGAVISRKRLAETMVKAVAWAPDGQTVYAAEQSPDAFLHALDPATLEPRWRRRLADELESSPPPPAADLYGVYSLPAAFSIKVLADGDLVVAGTHGWADREGVRQNRARLYRLAPDGSTRAAWPADGPAGVTLLFPRVDVEAGLVAVPINHSAAAPPPEGVPVGGILVLRLADLTPVGGFTADPLPPHFREARLWEAVDVRGSPPILLGGYGDGRVLLHAMESGTTTELALGTPVYAGEVPIAASVGWGFLTADAAVAITSGTNIPWGSTTTETRPPHPHPQANTLFVHELDGQLRWTWHGAHALQGVSASPDQRHLVMGAGPRSTDARRDLFGALIFRLEGEGSGADRLEATCATEGPVFFRQALADDGRVAVSESPFANESGGVDGAYRVTVMR